MSHLVIFSTPLLAEKTSWSLSSSSIKTVYLEADHRIPSWRFNNSLRITPSLRFMSFMTSDILPSSHLVLCDSDGKYSAKNLFQNIPVTACCLFYSLLRHSGSSIMLLTDLTLLDVSNKKWFNDSRVQSSVSTNVSGRELIITSISVSTIFIISPDGIFSVFIKFMATVPKLHGWWIGELNLQCWCVHNFHGQFTILFSYFTDFILCSVKICAIITINFI